MQKPSKVGDESLQRRPPGGGHDDRRPRRPLDGTLCLADDFLPKRPKWLPGRKPQISDAELVCLDVAQVMLDCPKERRFLRCAKRRLGHLFPYIPGQSGYNKRVRTLAPRIVELLGYLAQISPSWCDNLRLVDATSVPCGASRQTVKRSEFAGHAAYGYCAAHSRHFWGFKLYLLASPDGMPIAFELVAANVSEREVVAQMLEFPSADYRSTRGWLAGRGTDSSRGS